MCLYNIIWWCKPAWINTQTISMHHTQYTILNVQNAKQGNTKYKTKNRECEIQNMKKIIQNNQTKFKIQNKTNKIQNTKSSDKCKRTLIIQNYLQSFMNCSLFFFMTCPCLVYNLFTFFSLLLHDLFKTVGS